MGRKSLKRRGGSPRTDARPTLMPGARSSFPEAPARSVMPDLFQPPATNRVSGGGLNPETTLNQVQGRVTSGRQAGLRCSDHAPPGRRPPALRELMRGECRPRAEPMPDARRAGGGGCRAAAGAKTAMPERLGRSNATPRPLATAWRTNIGKVEALSQPAFAHLA